MADYNFANNGQGRLNADGSPRPGYIARMYWAVIGAVLGAALLLRICEFALGVQRKRSQNWRPKFVTARMPAVVMPVGRALTYLTPPFLQRYPGFVYFPSFGRTLLVLCYFGLLLGLFFYRNPLTDPSQFQTTLYRACWLSIAQLPLIVLLSVKRLSVISLVTGSSSSVSLNFFHRWVARGLLLTATLHMFYVMRYFASFQALVFELKTNIMPRRGLGTWCILAWIVLVSSIRPIRHYVFELFFANHVISVLAFFIAVLKHTPIYAHVYIWIALSIYIADVALRWFLVLLNNISTSGLNYRATVSVMQDEKTLAIEVPMTSERLLNWKPGQFVRLQFPTTEPFMAHPFTIASLPEDNKMQFVIRVKNGFTKRLLEKTIRIGADLEKQNDTVDNVVARATYPVIIDGPYGRVGREWNQFDTVLSIVCGTGFTYGFAVFRGILHNRGAVRTLRLVWVVRNYSDIVTCRDLIERILKYRESGAFELSVLIQIFVSDASTIPTIGHSEFDKVLAQHAEFIKVIPGKPVIRDILRSVIDRAGGETGVAVCGGSSLTTEVKNDVAQLLATHAAHLRSDAQSCWVHSEQFES
ncbi:FAD-binding domain-containing protein [Lipomyces kononenkoae]|uniref:FAD-binding domain-containing protein n=1 Tax=Lipomyces kononenkoae TaxID=34357 RepID=A0ACC3T505_LIPKO